jgi:ankyrin repeat protein
MPCKQCGTKKPNKALFCSGCGIAFKSLNDIYDLDANEIRLIVRQSADPNEQDKQGQTPLMKLVERGSDPNTLIHRMQTLIDVGTDPNIQDNDGQTALILACKLYHQQQNEMIKLLLDAGTDPNLCDLYEVTALMKLIDRVHDDAFAHKRKSRYMGTLIKIIELFIDAGADLNQRGRYTQWNVLTYAIINNYDISLIEFLINAGVEFSQDDMNDIIGFISDNNDDYSEISDVIDEFLRNYLQEIRST